MLRKNKEQVVAELAERLRASDTLIVADYRGLTMSEIDGVRTKLLEHGARFTVVKNTLTKRAAEQAGLVQLNDFLDGPTAIAFVGDGDMVAVARTLNDTARQTKVLELKGGILQGRQVSAEEVQTLATLPPFEVLQGQVLGAVIGPLSAIVSLFNAPLQNLVGLIDARIEQQREEGDEPASETPAAETAPEPGEVSVAEDAPGADAEAGAGADAPEPEAEAPDTADEEPTEPAAEAAETTDENETNEEE
jgi:large subunit ribosomal protein L10